MGGFSLGALSFTAPVILLGLLVLPLLWLLVRRIPPAPREVRFPALRLLLGLGSAATTPRSAPLWLVLLRLLAAALLILGLARPILDAPPPLAGSGPLVLVVDDGWASAPSFERLRVALLRLLDAAALSGREAVLLPTAPAPGERAPRALGPMPAGALKAHVAALGPRPWPAERAQALAALDRLSLPKPATLVWLSDGLERDGVAGAMPGRDFARALAAHGSLRVLRPEAAAPLLSPDSPGGGLGARVLRAPQAKPARLWVGAYDAKGGLVAREPAVFAPGAARAKVAFTLPDGVRNQVVRLDLAGGGGAGAVALLDSRWQRRSVGLVSGDPGTAERPLLGDLFYLRRALSPYAALRLGDLDALLSPDLSVLILSDVGRLPEAEIDRLDSWTFAGGVLVRFAGPRLAAGADSLLPVRLRGGGRALGGVMSWERPARLAPFPRHSPFYGLTVPEDVRIRSQVLAEPEIGLDSKTWAALADGTPLVTAKPNGKGWIVLFHTTAGPQWSNLALSGLFVEMLRRVEDLGRATAAPAGDAPLPPLTALDGFGRIGPAPATALPLSPRDLESGRPGPSHPPGTYGPQDAARAFNLGPHLGPPQALTLPAGTAEGGYDGARPRDLSGWLLLGALILVLADGLLALRGGRGARAVGMAVLLALAASSPPHAARAEDAISPMRAALHTRLAYVRTHDARIDRISRQGLEGLTRVLAQRTSVELAAPAGLDIDRDPLIFYPLIYWPLTPDQAPLLPDARARLAHYLAVGGMILFDTRRPEGGIDPALARLLAGVDVPPLERLPPDHVLLRSFYLMRGAPGRFADGAVWVQRAGTGPDAPVSPVVIGGNDWAEAWAIDRAGDPVFAVVPGGAAQRELAYRFGINLVMYALNGTYKADQVHLPAILERLGQ